MTLFAPAQLLSTSAEAIMLPTAARMVTNEDRNKLRATCAIYSVVLTGSFAAVGAVLLLLGPSIFHVVFGPEFTEYAPLVQPVLAQTVAAGISSGALVGIRALSQGRKMAGLQTVNSAMRVVFVAAVLSLGLQAAVWAIALADMVGACLAWALFGAALKSSRPIDTTSSASVPVDGR